MKVFLNLCVGVIIILISYNCYAQNIDQNNVELLFIDSLTFESANIYVFHSKDLDTFYVWNYYYKDVIVRGGELLENHGLYDLLLYKLEGPVVIKKASQFKRIPSITYSQKVFSLNDTVKVNLYYSPNVLKDYYLKTISDF